MQIRTVDSGDGDLLLELEVLPDPIQLQGVANLLRYSILWMRFALPRRDGNKIRPLSTASL